MKITTYFWKVLPDREFSIENIIENLDNHIAVFMKRNPNEYWMKIDYILPLYGVDMKIKGECNYVWDEIMSLNIFSITIDNAAEILTMQPDDIRYIENNISEE